MASIEDRIKNIVVELLGVDEERVVPEARFREDLEADSLDLVELIMAFEEEFGGEITDEDAQSITTVGEAVAYIKKMGSSGQLASRPPDLRDNCKLPRLITKLARYCCRNNCAFLQHEPED
jgi:acyl carrier protein